MTAQRCIIVMGVSGSGKTTVAKGIAEALGWEFAEGDDFHPQANVDKMASGHPLTDEDRWPWLRKIGDFVTGELEKGRSVVVTCSALKRSYRDLLREGRPQLCFCHVAAEPDVIAERLKVRKGHYMPPSLLPSQVHTLQPLEPDEPGVTVSAADTPEEVVQHAISALGLTREETAG